MRTFCLARSNFCLALMATTASLLSVASAQSACPPEGLDTLSTLDIVSFVSAPWFSVKAQAPVSFLDVDSLFCLRQVYTLLDSNPRACRFPRCRDFSFININNTGNSGSVDGPQDGIPDAITLLGSVRESGKIFVGTSFTPERFWEPLFVYAAGTFDELLTLELSELAQEPRSNQYDWAVLAGDLPALDTGNGCLSGPSDPSNSQGIFLFSRDPLASQEIIDRIDAVAAFLGFDTSALFQVEFEGCTFPPL